MKRWYLLVLIVLVAAVVVYIKVAAQPQLSDEAQIKAMLQQGETAIESKDSKFLTSCISQKYSDHYGNKCDTMRMELIQLMQDGGTYDVKTGAPVIAVNGDKATAALAVAVTLTSGEYGHSFSHPMTFTFAKEKAKRLLFLHTQVWRVTSVDHLPDEF